MFRYILIAVTSAVFSAMASAQVPVRFHNEAADTARIDRMLIEAEAADLPGAGARIEWLGRQLLGTTYVGHTLEGQPEMVTVNLDELDCTTYVETVLAMAMTLGERRSSWRDFVYNLQRVRYRGGTVDGYPSRLHYICDWIVDNTHRGNFDDVTNRMPKYNYVVKTIDYMSANADKYPALADSANLARVRDTEVGYRNHRFPYVKSADAADKAVKGALRTGDVVALTSSLKNLDVTHMGIIVNKDGEPYLMHASSSAGKVVVSDLPLDRFLKRNRQFTGFRVIRLRD